jgi:lipoate-protein ligase A
MRFDEKLLEQLDPQGKPILHLYQWAGPSATYGYFIAPEKHLDLKKAEKHHLSLARRPTGGGIVFHIWDLAFSFLMPSAHPAFSLNTLENYRFVNEAVLELIRAFFALRAPVEIIPESVSFFGVDCQNFCMAKPTQYDVVYKGMKIAGAAQRKRRQGYLHQGTISLACPHFDLLSDVLLSKKEVLQAMATYSFAPLGRIWEPMQLKQVRLDLQKKLADKLVEKLSPFHL